MANPRFRSLTQKLTKKHITIFSIALTFILYSSFFNSSPLNRTPTFNLSNYVPLTLVTNAHHKGAFCLDGSLPGYHFEKGFGSGSYNWILHIEGGGWCDSITSCSIRKTTALGSSRYMDHQVIFSGILSHNSSENPDFFNWNRVKVRYCDGSSFAGHPESEFHNGTNLFFRGQLIWEALMDELLQIGMSNARQSLLSGCSAGGLATMIHCDDFQAKLPKAAVKCLADASFFLDEKDVSGRSTMWSFYHNVVNLHGAKRSLPQDCVAKMDPSLCFFPEQIIKSIKTPIFLVNPTYDFWQIQHVLVPTESDVSGDWRTCRLSIHKCNSYQMETLQGFRNSMLNALGEFKKSKARGMFMNSCFSHCQTWMGTWHGLNTPKIDNKTIAEAVGHWYFNHEEVKLIDCPFPCNPTCYNLDFTRA